MQGDGTKGLKRDTPWTTAWCGAQVGGKEEKVALHPARLYERESSA